MWLTSDENWCFLDYRTNFKGKITIANITHPDGFDLPKLIALATKIPSILEDHDTPPFVPAIKRQTSDPHIEVDSDSPESSSSLDSDSSPQNIQIATECDPSDYLNPEVFEHKEEKNKRRKITYDGVMYEPPLHDEMVRNQIASYERALEEVADDLITQFVFGRKIWRGMDSQFLARVMHHSSLDVQIPVEIFPGTLFSSFYHWTFRLLFGAEQTLPPMYCLMCGHDDRGPHDMEAHADFCSAVDPLLLHKWSKVTTIIELVRTLAVYFLQNPNQRQTLQRVAFYLLHCPFCGEKNGSHCEKTHLHWKMLCRIDNDGKQATIQRDGDLHDYAVSCFQYVFTDIPFTIPPHLFDIQNIESFFEFMITVYNSTRLDWSPEKSL